MGGSLAKVIRLDNWPILLSRFLVASQNKPFKWGEHDCLLFSASAVEAITGVDLAHEWRGKYDSEAGADNILSGYGGLMMAVTQTLWSTPVDNYRMANRGDIVMIKETYRPSLGVVDDSGRRIAIVTPSGLARIPLKKALWVWGY